MSAPELAIVPYKPREIQPFQSQTAQGAKTEKMLDEMEVLNNQIIPYMPKNLPIQTKQLTSLPPKIQGELSEILDSFSKSVGHKPLSQRLMELHQRMGQIAERHFMKKHDQEFHKKQEIQGNIHDQKGWRNWQAFTHGAGGSASLIFGIAAGAIAPYSPQLSEVLKSLVSSGIFHSATQGGTTLIEGQILPLSHEAQFYLSTIQSDKQSIEGIKNALHQLLQLALEVERQETQSYKEIAQR